MFFREVFLMTLKKFPFIPHLLEVLVRDQFGFCQMILLHCKTMRFFLFLCFMFVNNGALHWWIFWILKQHCMPGMTPFCCDIAVFICCWIRFSIILLRIFHIYIHETAICSFLLPSSVLVSKHHWPQKS